MRRRRPDRPRGSSWAPALALLVAATGAHAQALADLQNTKHNLSISGPGPVRALTEDRICVFCHTPHNATPQSPLWNRELPPQAYVVYSSPTLGAGPIPQPSGPTRLCLSCHDGTVAMGTVVVPETGIAMAGDGHLPPDSLGDFGIDLSAHHPVSFSYSSALPNPELVPIPPPELTLGGADEMHCSTCHDPHNDQYGQFLVRDNRYSQLCIRCHQIPGWIGSQHQTSTESTVGILPRPPRTESTWTTIAEWGCETCHTPHFAATPPQLLNFTAGPPEPFSCTSAGCHSAEPGPPHAAAPGMPRTHLLALDDGRGGKRADIAGQVRKASAHHETPGVFSTSRRDADAAARSGIRAVGCGDCHNEHSATDIRGEAPFVSGLLRDVNGINRRGVEVDPAQFEYEICFKCHGDNAGDFERVPRVVSSTNNRLDFDPANPSSHPVVGTSSGRSPSLRGDAGVSSNGSIYCSSCHADDDDVSDGPHGSDYAPILRLRYDLHGGAESYDSYALCYSCHDRSSILGNQSFRAKGAGRTTATGGGHSGHLATGASCATCHDPHGVPSRWGGVPGGRPIGGPGAVGGGSHTNLINFDTRSAQGLEGTGEPIYEDLGPGSGSCTLMCHGVKHDHLTYP